MHSDLAVEAFKVFRKVFFAEDGSPIDFKLRDKRNTQDDPFDEYLAALLHERTPDDIICERASGPLITPDMALLRPALCNKASRAELKTDLTRIVGIEVKKLERGQNGMVGRSSGLDYNTTPPCGTVRAYDGSNSPLDIRGFYLFVCLEWGAEPGSCTLTALTLCDGNALNADFDYYLSVAGQRSKEIGVGTYGDGANRNRPMVIFANPLGAKVLDHRVTLLHERADLADYDPELIVAGRIRRTVPDNGPAEFHCYRLAGDPVDEFDLLDPFPTPKNRSEKTTGRGRFRINVRPSG